MDIREFKMCVQLPSNEISVVNWVFTCDNIDGNIGKYQQHRVCNKRFLFLVFLGFFATMGGVAGRNTL